MRYAKARALSSRDRRRATSCSAPERWRCSAVSCWPHDGRSRNPQRLQPCHVPPYGRRHLRRPLPASSFYVLQVTLSTWRRAVTDADRGPSTLAKSTSPADHTALFNQELSRTFRDSDPSKGEGSRGDCLRKLERSVYFCTFELGVEPRRLAIDDERVAKEKRNRM